MPTHFKGTSEEERALNAFIKLTRACDSLSARIAGHSPIEDLTESQFGVLEILYHLGPMCPGELGQKLLKSTGNMTMVIDNLEKRAFVRRDRSTEDRRQIKIVLTDAGREKIARIFPNMAAVITEEFGVLTPEEQDELGRLCKKLGRRSEIALKDPAGESRG